jgi:multidrug efflux pump
MWWKQLATAVVFGLGIATVLTLIVTPALLAARVWLGAGFAAFAEAVRAWLGGAESPTARDRALRRALQAAHAEDMVWTDPSPELRAVATTTPRAAE